jgi:hypothetical protein
MSWPSTCLTVRTVMAGPSASGRKKNTSDSIWRVCVRPVHVALHLVVVLGADDKRELRLEVCDVSGDQSEQCLERGGFRTASGARKQGERGKHGHRDADHESQYSAPAARVRRQTKKGGSPSGLPPVESKLRIVGAGRQTRP